MDDLTLTPEQYNAYVVHEAIKATAPAAERPHETCARIGAIVEMVKGFEPMTALEALMACHCIGLRYVLMGAIGAAVAGSEDARLALRQRALVATLARTTDQAEAQYERMQARGEARAAGMGNASVQSPVQSPVPSPGQPPGKPAPADTPRAGAGRDAPREAGKGAAPEAGPRTAPMPPAMLAPRPAPGPALAVPPSPVAPSPVAPSPVAPSPVAQVMRDGADLSPGVMPFPHAERVSLPDPASVPVLDAIRAALPDPARAAREALLASTALAAGTVPGDTPVGTPRDATPGTRDRRPAMGG